MASQAIRNEEDGKTLSRDIAIDFTSKYSNSTNVDDGEARINRRVVSSICSKFMRNGRGCFAETTKGVGIEVIQNAAVETRRNQWEASGLLE